MALELVHFLLFLTLSLFGVYEHLGIACTNVSYKKNNPYSQSPKCFRMHFFIPYLAAGTRGIPPASSKLIIASSHGNHLFDDVILNTTPSTKAINNLRAKVPIFMVKDIDKNFIAH